MATTAYAQFSQEERDGARAQFRTELESVLCYEPSLDFATNVVFEIASSSPLLQIFKLDEFCDFPPMWFAVTTDDPTEAKRLFDEATQDIVSVIEIGLHYRNVRNTQLREEEREVSRQRREAARQEIAEAHHLAAQERASARRERANDGSQGYSDEDEEDDELDDSSTDEDDEEDEEEDECIDELSHQWDFDEEKWAAAREKICLYEAGRRAQLSL